MSGELVFNLWAIYDMKVGFVYALAGKAYSASGSAADKLAILKSLAASDYTTAKRYGVAGRFNVCFADGTVKRGVAPLQAIADPNAHLFEEIFKNIEAELPPVADVSGAEFKAVKQKIPDDPLCVTTVLYEDDHGNIRPIISEEDKQWVANQERIRGRTRAT
jgi:hypothetical protein